MKPNGLRPKMGEKAKALTKWTKSLAAIARMSAQDTTPGHLLSTNALAFLMLSNASGLRPLLSTASFSAATLLPGFVDIRIDPSQPCHFQELSQNPENDEQSEKTEKRKRDRHY
uniref:Uncharacterized protein n=1 Tax=Cucumis melo TaxID=3656 RepID=A0A9I9EM69_CUCME